MAGIGPDDVRHRHAFIFERGGHQVGGLFLFIYITAVSHDGGVEKIGGNRRHIVEVPQLLFPPSRLGFLGKNILVNSGVYKPRAR